MSIYKNKILEHARVSINEKQLESYRGNYNDLKESVEGLSGNQGFSTWQNINNPNQIVDLGLWSDFNSAQKADELVQQNGDFARFFESVESVDHFDHFEFINELENSEIDKNTFLEIYLYKIDEAKASNHLEKKQAFAQMLKSKVKGFVQYSWFKSVKDPKVQLDLYWYKHTETELAENAAIEQDPIAGAMMSTITSMDWYQTYLPFKPAIEKVDLTKTKKSYYKAKLKPELLKLDWHNYISVKGKGAPESKAFEQAMGMIYPVAYKTKFKLKSLGRDYVVPKMEGFWYVESGEFADAAREDWCWQVMIPLPNFVHPKMVQSIINELGFEKIVNVELQEPGTHAQIMHIGSYEAEDESLKTLHGFIEKSGYKMAGYHREVYIKDPMKTEESKLKTILRYQVEVK
ncbi:MAG: GyrI-like domain-containing protein [Bacteroidia bacterium]